MSIDAAQVLSLIGSAGRLVGLKEILRAGELNPGVQNDLKRILRELVRSGQLEQDGKRFGLPGKKHTQKSGPAWKGKPAKAATPAAPVKGAKKPAPRGRFVRQWGEGFVSDAKAAAPAPAARGKKSAAVKAISAPPPPTPPRPAAVSKKGAPKGRHQQQSKAAGPPPPAARGTLVTGIINHHRDGFAFVKPLGAKTGEDIFIPPEQARQALDHDQVVVEVIR